MADKWKVKSFKWEPKTSTDFLNKQHIRFKDGTERLTMIGCFNVQHIFIGITKQSDSEDVLFEITDIYDRRHANNQHFIARLPVKSLENVLMLVHVLLDLD